MKELSIGEYAKALAKEHTRKSDGWLEQLWEEANPERRDFEQDDSLRLYRCEEFLDFCIFPMPELLIEFESPKYAELDWLLECEKIPRPYFEMCGPRISKQDAERLTERYQKSGAFQEVWGTLCGFGCEGLAQKNYGLFHPDGRVGLNGSFWYTDARGQPSTEHCNLLLCLLQMIWAQPQLEFALLVTKWDEMPDRFRDTPEEQLPSTWQFDPQPEDVVYGVAYDPKKQKMSVLGPKSAWKAVKDYQRQYTKEERQVFDPVQGQRYYETDPKGRRELRELLKKELPEPFAAEIPLQLYLDRLWEKQGDDDFRQPPWFCEEWRERYAQLDLKILFDEAPMKTAQWLMITYEGARWPHQEGSRYFELCGPKISKELAMEMAADYNEPTIRSTLGEMAHYDPNGGRGVFRLDGCVCQNGTQLKAASNHEVLDALLDLIKTYPRFEFAMRIIRSPKKPRKDGGMSACQKNQVEYGAHYDPSSNVLRILSAHHANQMVQKYQAQYTKEEQRLFERAASERYYGKNSKGRKELEEFLCYQQTVFHKQV